MLHTPQSLSIPPQLTVLDGAEMERQIQLSQSNRYTRPVAPKSSGCGDGSVKIRMKITPEDLEDWRSAPCLHPLVGVLRRTTHTGWRMVDAIMLAEREPPFRTVFLGTELMLQLLDCKNGYGPGCLECEVELLLPFSD